MKYTLTQLQYVIIASLITPFAAMAQETPVLLLGRLIEYAVDAINFLLVLATLVFLWGVIKYISAGGDAAKVKEARSYILWGLIGLAIMGSVWAIVRFVQRGVGGSESGEQEIPSYTLQ
jgi:hypothetical protein